MGRLSVPSYGSWGDSVAPQICSYVCCDAQSRVQYEEVVRFLPGEKTKGRKGINSRIACKECGPNNEHQLCVPTQAAPTSGHLHITSQAFKVPRAPARAILLDPGRVGHGNNFSEFGKVTRVFQSTGKPDGQKVG